MSLKSACVKCANNLLISYIITDIDLFAFCLTLDLGSPLHCSSNTFAISIFGCDPVFSYKKKQNPKKPMNSVRHKHVPEIPPSFTPT